MLLDLYCYTVLETTVENLKLGSEPRGREKLMVALTGRTPIPLTSTSIRPHPNSPDLTRTWGLWARPLMDQEFRLL